MHDTDPYAGLDLEGIARRLAAVHGVVAVTLGGSRARGTHRPDSDIDLGLYYRGPLAVHDLRALAREITGHETDVTEPGGWGPWVDGGGWLIVDGRQVDWIYRDLDRVQQVWRDCRAGRYEVGFQAGHPLGFYSHAYAGEVALFRAIGVACHALHAADGAWLINEKGMIGSAARLPSAPERFGERAQALLAHVGATPEEIGRTLDAAAELVAEVRAACEGTQRSDV
ncbi:nucleotidyltransferase domain-containing protein [Nonomuraea sp. NPDC049421]|uniref:nucleotidyltransferase family protein n=1 Tax=Nonomuraea sp. NPDC049421 TaxID=3155275 RepID=UPI00343C3D8F